MKIEISKLNPHPKNRFIYGFEDNSDLLEKIKQTNWIKPILITKDTHTIISGHRRVEVCKILGIEEIEYELIEENDPTILLELLMMENQYRVKTNSQMMKESEIFFEIEKQKSYKRMMSGVNPETDCLRGSTSKIVSDKIGMGETTYKKGKKVLEFIDKHPDYTWFFENLMNESMDKSVQMIEKSPEFLEDVIEKVGDDKSQIFTVIKEMEQEEGKSKTPLPPGKYGLIILDITNKETDDISQTDISSMCEDDCLLFIWVKPQQVDSGIRICKQWGFKYQTCLLWNKDLKKEITLNGELLLVSVRGNPNIIFREFEDSSEKPELVEEIIRKGYPDYLKVELINGEGWKIW